MLRVVMKKVNNMHEQMGNVRREMKTPRMIQKESLEIFKRLQKK